jgi:hypothetical protein
MARRRVSDEALAQWFSFEPVTQPVVAAYKAKARAAARTALAR